MAKNKKLRKEKRIDLLKEVINRFIVDLNTGVFKSKYLSVNNLYERYDDIKILYDVYSDVVYGRIIGSINQKGKIHDEIEYLDEWGDRCLDVILDTFKCLLVTYTKNGNTHVNLLHNVVRYPSDDRLYFKNRIYTLYNVYELSKYNHFDVGLEFGGWGVIHLYELLRTPKYIYNDLELDNTYDIQIGKCISNLKYVDEIKVVGIKHNEVKYAPKIVLMLQCCFKVFSIKFEEFNFRLSLNNDILDDIHITNSESCNDYKTHYQQEYSKKLFDLVFDNPHMKFTKYQINIIVNNFYGTSNEEYVFDKLNKLGYGLFLPGAYSTLKLMKGFIDGDN